MPRRSTSKKEASQISLGSPQKRSVPDDPYEIPDDEVPVRKRTRTSLKQREEPEEEEVEEDDEEEDTNLRGGESEPLPKPARRGRPPRTEVVTNGNGTGEVSTPTTSRKKNAVVETPSRKALDTPSRRNIADRSARRKSARALIDRVVNDALSDDEQEDEGIAREIYESSEEEDEDEQPQPQEDGDEEDNDEESENEPAVAPTPTKRRGRPPGSGKKPQSQQRKRSPTPPVDLPPHEQYFYQNKPGRPKTSNNTLSSLDLLTHDEYFSLLRQTKDPHAKNIQFLESLHAKSFAQWDFELSQGFTTCLFGYGSKRRLMHQFATYISSRTKSSSSKIVIINGYLKTLTIREILSTLGSAIDPSTKIPSANPQAMVINLLRLLNNSPSSSALYIFINSIDASPLRKPTVQSILSQLAAHPKIHLICSADTSDFPLLWDSGLRSSFNFLFHDCTTFSPLSGRSGSGEIEVVDEVHELLGRMARRVGGKEGVTFVLRSLPENAKNLFRLLVTEVLVAMDDGNGDGNTSAEGVGIEYRMMYNKAVEEFICSSEMAFRTLLKEFHDHQIIESHKDSIGTELLSLPFRKDELETILEDLMS